MLFFFLQLAFRDVGAKSSSYPVRHVYLPCYQRIAPHAPGRRVGLWSQDAFAMNSVWFYLGIYFGLGCAYGAITFMRSTTFLFGCVNATLNLHNQLLHHIMRLPKAFWDTNPAGRVLNRFSRDVDVMDSVLSASLIQFTGCVATYLAILVVISIATKWFAIALVPITLIYVMVQRFYIPAARELQRIESISRSPIYSRFAEAVAGVATIRAYGRSAYFTAQSDALMEENAYAFVTQKAAASWLAMRLDFMGLCILTLTALLCIQVRRRSTSACRSPIYFLLFALATMMAA